MQNTVNLNLKKPDQNDFVNIGDINDNMDTLDAEVAKKYVKPLAGIPSLDLDSATQAALKKAETALQTVTKSSVGLGNVDNTSDVNKPVSTAQQVALDKKANLASPSLTGTPTAPTAAESTNTQQIATTAFVDRAVKTHQADLAHVHWIGTATGTNTLTATYEAITALKNGLGVAFLNTTSSTGATTLNINGLGAIPILKANGNPVTNLKANGIYTLRYANGNFILQGEGGSGNAIASDLLSGKTASTDAGDIVGTIPSKTTQTYTPGTTNQTITSGQYLSGTQTILGDPDLIPANILSGKTIFGVTGSYNQLVPGDFLVHDNPTQSYYNGNVMTKMKETVIGADGIYRVEFKMSSNSNVQYQAQIYVNDIPKGILRLHENNIGATFTEDLSLKSGDKLQIYAKGISGIYVYVEKLRIYIKPLPIPYSFSIIL